ncbi:MAG: DNA repair protein RecN [Bacteroidales bacterium]|jgi:DNA repair protein RecN (Recombination protein N)|nr:DNA repair protein RecN [Bacteroidales bacterium]MCK9498567.1 DNA repair protein RecN [Bacteroidales bacterium]MDY0314463.1 DNA repair protein RecN [Bacteroidales bacterium]NLB87203.1 DNA repair protein RecN [Bacteroidales bacterium]
MLKSLLINNYLLIDNLEINFNSGFSVITGETGAGKSIMLDAISLLLGKRADTDVLSDKTRKCIIEAKFSLNQDKFQKDFLKNDLDFEKTTIIRREILPEGKSRAFINDTPVTLAVLKSIGDKLIDIHSQHENLNLGLMQFRTQIVDIAAGTKEMASQFSEKFNNLNKLEAEISKLKIEIEKNIKEKEFCQFQAEQIEQANINDENELEELEEKSSLLENAVEIKESLYNSINLARDIEFSAEARLKEIRNLVSKLSVKYKPAKNLADRLDSILIDFKDIYSQIEDDLDKAEINPELLQETNDRIDLINGLLQKHKLANISELKNKYLDLINFINSSDNLEQSLSVKEKEFEVLKSETLEFAEKLSQKRQRVFSKVEKEITGILVNLGIKHANFLIENIRDTKLSLHGFDNINFLFSANKSITPQAIEKIASGGEYSRLMLALKSQIAHAASVPTIIFDEIDTGVSGEIANKMGKIMKDLGESFQVVGITHLAQVAALGTNHYKIYKHSDEKRTYTKVKILNREERITEIAGIISGEKLTSQAIDNARILLEN